MNTFPVRLRITPKAKAELEASEYGSYEDSTDARREYHTVTICQQSPHGFLEVRTQEQANELLYALSTGTFGLREKGFIRTCRRLYEEIAPYAADRARRTWRYPDGL